MKKGTKLTTPINAAGDGISEEGAQSPRAVQTGASKIGSEKSHSGQVSSNKGARAAARATRTATAQAATTTKRAAASIRKNYLSCIWRGRKCLHTDVPC